MSREYFVRGWKSNKKERKSLKEHSINYAEGETIDLCIHVVDSVNDFMFFMSIVAEM